MGQNNRRYGNVGFYITDKRKEREKEENILKMNICFFLQRRRKIEMEKGGNNWTRKIFFAGEKKNREGNKENTKGEGHGGKYLKRGKIFGERNFLEDMKMEEKLDLNVQFVRMITTVLSCVPRIRLSQSWLSLKPL